MAKKIYEYMFLELFFCFRFMNKFEFVTTVNT